MMRTVADERKLETLAGLKLTVKKYIILETRKCSHSVHSLCPQFIMYKPTDALMCLVVLERVTWHFFLMNEISMLFL